jgi:hypothetical protein
LAIGIALGVPFEREDMIRTFVGKCAGRFPSASTAIGTIAPLRLSASKSFGIAVLLRLLRDGAGGGQWVSAGAE